MIHYSKHRKEVEVFINSFLSFNSTSEIFSKYQKRFNKNKDKLFTFLNHDGIPWNNNAVKTFALYRKITDGCFTEKGIRKYLVLLSIYQTCKYRNISFLEFLKSKGINIDKF